MPRRFVSKEEAEAVVSERFQGRRMTRFPRGQLITRVRFRAGDPFDRPGELNVFWELRSNLFNEEAENFDGVGVTSEEVRAWSAAAFGVEPAEVDLWCDQYQS
jgi:hypothetical protein